MLLFLLSVYYYFKFHLDLFFIFVGLFSLCIGSFLNVLIYRLPILLINSWKKECSEFLELNNNYKSALPTSPFNLAVPSSFCPHCKTPIPWWQNIPLISYLLLRGHCAFCKAAISWRYPFVEIMTLFFSLGLSWHFGVSLQTLFALILTWGLIGMSWIDLDHQLLPDVMNLGLLWLGLLANTFELFCSLSDAVLGAVIGYISLWIFANLFKWITKKDGMGNGDFKLLATLGAWLGWQSLPLILILSTLLGSIIGISLMATKKIERQIPIPFGPFLALAGWIALLWGDTITNTYLKYL